MKKLHSFVSNLRMKAAEKRRQGFTLIEIMVACAIIIALSVGAFFGYSQAQQSRKMAQMRQDMEAICTAALAYEALSINSTPPASIDALMTGLTAANSVDGVAHQFLTQARGSSSGSSATKSILDPWNAAYTYSQTERTVKCTPQDASGKAMAEVTRNF